jgi:ketol-acid reductoisomerase
VNFKDVHLEVAEGTIVSYRQFIGNTTTVRRLWVENWKENENGQKNFLQMRKDLADHPIEKVGEKLRGMMPWISDNKIIDKDKN